MAGCPRAYKGVSDCFYRILKEEGVGAFYRSLPPRLMSVVPMIAIQFGVYEALKSKFQDSNKEQRILAAKALKKRTLNGVSIVRTSAVAMARTARKTSANVSLKAKGKVLDIRTRRRLNRDKIVELGIPDEEHTHEEDTSAI
jgi:Mitochondrial carrier protein